MLFRAAFAAILVGVLCLWGQPVAGQQWQKSAVVPLSDFVKPQYVEGSVQKWAKARSAYYSIRFDRHVTIGVKPAATRYLVATYEKGVLPRSFIEMKAVFPGIAVSQDIDVVLDRSLQIEINHQFGSMGQFIAEIHARKTSGVALGTKSIMASIRKSDCQIIPCDPKLCNPDACAASSIKRTFHPKQQ